MQLIQQTRSPKGMGYFQGNAGRFNDEPYTADDYRAQTNALYAPGGANAYGRGTYMPPGYDANGFKQAPAAAPSPAAPAPAPQPQASPFTYDTGISPYQRAMSPLQSLYNAKPSTYPGQTPGQQQAAQTHHTQLLRGLAGPMRLGTEENARVMDAQHGLARDQAQANMGLQFGGLGLGLLGNQMQAQAPFDAFAANQMTMPINAISGLLRGLLN